jgi:hypothetical protein
MPAVPHLDIKTGFNHSPHVVILGAGASRACCPNGDANGNVLPVMADIVSTLKLQELVKDAGHNANENFESVYSAIYKSGNEVLLNQLDAAVRFYFERLTLPATPTLYDYLVLSLRPKDAIVTFNWDPLLPQAYKRWRHLGAILPEVFYLHGNVDIGIDTDKKVSGFLSDEPDPRRKLAPSAVPTRCLGMAVLIRVGFASRSPPYKLLDHHARACRGHPRL